MTMQAATCRWRVLFYSAFWIVLNEKYNWMYSSLPETNSKLVPYFIGKPQEKIIGDEYAKVNDNIKIHTQKLRWKIME